MRRSDVGDVTFAPVTVEGRDVDGDGLIEVDFGSARVRIGRGAEVGVALAVIEALRGQR